MPSRRSRLVAPPRSSSAAARRACTSPVPRRSTPSCSTRGSGLRHLLRIPGHGAGTWRHGRAHGAASSAARARVVTPGTLFSDVPGEVSVWMCHGDSVSEAPAGFLVTAQSTALRSPRSSNEVIVWRACSGIRRCAHPSYGQRVSGELPARLGGPGRRLDERRTSSTSRSSASAPRSARVGSSAGSRAGSTRRSPRSWSIGRWATGSPASSWITDCFAGSGRAGRARLVAATGIRLGWSMHRSGFWPRSLGSPIPRPSGTVSAGRHRRVRGRERGLVGEDGEHGSAVEFLVQGTLYPDVVESGGRSVTRGHQDPSRRGGLADRLPFTLVEPLRALFKDEVRQVGLDLGLPPEIVCRHRFPGPGLAIRILGAVRGTSGDPPRADHDHTRGAPGGRSVPRHLAVCGCCCRVRSWAFRATAVPTVVGRAGPVTSRDAVTADWSRLPYDLIARISTRITNEVREVNRVTVDVTSKPPGTIEWE